MTTKITTPHDWEALRISKHYMIRHLREEHGHIDSVDVMLKWDRDELERAHIDAHQEVSK